MLFVPLPYGNFEGETEISRREPKLIPFGIGQGMSPLGFFVWVKESHNTLAFALDVTHGSMASWTISTSHQVT